MTCVVRSVFGSAQLFLGFVVVVVVVGGLRDQAHRHGTSLSADDFRVVPYAELLQSHGLVVFRSDGIEDFDRLLIDSDRRQIIVGARNYLLRLHSETLQQLEALAWKADDITTTICLAKGQLQDDCHNLVRVLVLDGDRLFTCGTNAFSPHCYWRNPRNLSSIDGARKSGVALCPYSPKQNSTALVTSTGDIYTATVTDFTARDPAIYRALGPSKHLRTVQYNTRWLNEPDFVSMYEIGDYVYVFFREVAIEYINCGKNVYSRVARICKSDHGGDNFLLEDNWTTFVKARLNCSLPGAYPFYFNELQSTYLAVDEQLVYAVFTTSTTSIYASAICVYNMTAIDRAFSGPYKYQADPQMAWGRVPNPSPNEQCPGSHPVSGKHQRLLVDAQKFQMMDNAVQGASLQPLFVAEKQRYTHIALDRVTVNRGSTVTSSYITVLYLATLEGSVLKMALVPGRNGADTAVCLVEVLRLAADNTSSPGYIRSLQLHVSKKALLIGTVNRVYLVPTQRCSRFTSRILCIAAQDPYCGWDEKASQCRAIGNSNLSSCPILTYPVDGEWSSWSAWSPCSYVEVGTATDQCLCRSRSCDSPRPRHGGRECHGRAVEVSNCTVHGGWTTWAVWSPCSLSCGVDSVRTRRRTCSSPEPRSGGRICVGEEVQIEDCKVPLCQPPVDGQWSAWSNWSPCSNDCGQGYQSRARLCDNPQPENGGLPCVGNDVEWRHCHSSNCEEVRKFSDWSPWYRTNSTGEGRTYREERYRCTCRADVTDPGLLRAPVVTTTIRHCSAKDVCDTEVYGVPDVDGSWTSWSAWTDCSALCGGGSQRRYRSCSAPRPSGAGRDCSGAASESRLCNSLPCVGQWSCWSEPSPCSVTCGPRGTRRRHRQCVWPAVGGITCPGNDTEVLDCGAQHLQCDTNAGSWSSWSDCNADGVQQRRQPCTSCENGVEVQKRVCDASTGEPAGDEVIRVSSSSSSSSLGVAAVAVSGLIGFLVGAFFSGLVTFLVVRRRGQWTLDRRRPTVSNPNDYSCALKAPPHPVLTPDYGYGSLGPEDEPTPHRPTVNDASTRLLLMLQSADGFKMRTKLDSVDSELM